MRKGEISEFKKISPFLYYWQYCFLVEVIKMEKKSNTVKKKKTKRLDAKENFWGYVFLSPVIIGFLVFTVFPVVMSFYYSLTNYDGIQPPKFVGFQNYAMLFTNKEFGEALFHTVYFTIGTVPVGVFLVILVAVLLNQKIHGVNVYRSAFFIPVIVSYVSITMVWQWLYNEDFLWMISSSLKDVQELYAIPPYWIPKHVAWENYVYMFEQAPWFVYFGNTIFITVFTILGQLITCSMAAYAFARLNFKGKNILFIIYLGTMMIPFQAVMIPQFKIIKYMGLIDTKSSLVAVGIFNAFGTFLLRQFFLTIPKELEEAAKIDGCSYPRIFWEVILKNSKPALMTLIIFTFMNTWNDFLRPLIFINSEEKWTLAMGLAQFQGTYVSQWNQMMAGALISMLPILLVYIFAQKYFVQGIVMSGIKG